MTPVCTAENETGLVNVYYERPAICSVLHYLRDWTPTLAEVRRVLKPDGGQRHASPGRTQARLLRGLHLDRRNAHAGPDRPDDLLAQATAGDD